MTKNLVTFLLLLIVAGSFAQTAVTIPIVTKDNATILQTDKDGSLNIVYFGKKLVNAEEYALVSGQYNMKDGNAVISNNAYTPAGSWSLVELALQVTHADGNNSLELKYVSSELKKTDNNVSVTSIVMKDPVYPFEVTLFYKTYFKENVVEQWSVIKHTESTPLF